MNARVTARVTHEKAAAFAEAFGFADKKGREFGYRVNVYRVTAVADDTVSRDEACHVVPSDLGTQYRVHGQAMRGGQEFGATQPAQRRATEAEAMDLAKSLIINAKARYSIHKDRA